MARTYRKPLEERERWWRKEKKEFRKQTNRKARRDTKRAIKVDSDEFPLYKGTQGYLTH